MKTEPKIDLNDPGINEYAAQTEQDFAIDGIAMTLAYRFQQGELSDRGIEVALEWLQRHSKVNPMASFIYAEFLGGAGSEGDNGELTKALHIRAIELALPRLRDAEEPFDEAPRSENRVREIIGMCLTNVGARLANSGSQYEAASFFRRSIRMYPAIPNTFVCLGNMAIYHPERSKVPPEEGYDAWKTANELEIQFPYLAGPPDRFRSDLVANCETIERLYGRPEVAKWLSRVTTKIGMIKRWPCTPVFMTLSDYPKDGHFSQSAAAVDRFFELLRGSFGSTVPLEVKVTIAASILANLSLLGGKTAIDHDAISQAMSLCAWAEPLHPLIGDDEWEDLAPPETNYLLERETQVKLLRRINIVMEAFRQEMKDVNEFDALVGYLSKFDRRFRKGIWMMVETSYGNQTGLWIGRVYTPGTYIGKPADEKLAEVTA